MVVKHQVRLPMLSGEALVPCLVHSVLFLPVAEVVHSTVMI